MSQTNQRKTIEAPYGTTDAQWEYVALLIDMSNHVIDTSNGRICHDDFARLIQLRDHPVVAHQLVSITNQLSFAIKLAKEKGLI